MKVVRSITGRQVKAIEAAWWLARGIDLPLNRFLSIRPHGIDDIRPEDRSALWSRYRNRLAQFARDNRFEFACVWSRESQPGTGNNEHLHVVMHVPPKLQKPFEAMVDRWSRALDDEKGKSGGGGSNSTPIDCRPATYRTSRNASGKKKNVITYLTKNSPQAAFTKERMLQKGGPVVGKRVGMTRNLDANCPTHRSHRERLQSDGSSRTLHRERITNFDAIISETPAVARQVAPKKIAGNSNYPDLLKGHAA
ncbi:hypothetical protein [Tardiphaga sp. vice278]|uniref:hypothetical protein n=1 Tax=Tardiphaga sp. vice278 TaxID=2592815 RepID=UPI0011644B68|nr:hypothetical protein [Tardiphaga sp. vice278]QDM15469.1 hypothetical protein FNL53_05580 [Tardiphaga sp. vice278]